MSEPSSNTFAMLVAHLVANGIPREKAVELVGENVSMPVVVGESWVLLDRAGEEAGKVPLPPEFTF